VHGLRSALEPIIEGAGVDLLLAGHVHLYERARPLCEYVAEARVLEVISGGGGAALDPPVANPNFPQTLSVTHYLRVAVTADTLDIRAVSLDGHVLDRVRRRRDSRPPCHPGGWPPPIEN
jgi:hypothetical protein